MDDGRAHRDLARLLVQSLPPAQRTRLLMRAGAQAAETCLRNHDVLARGDLGRASALRMWSAAWTELGRVRPDLFTVAPSGLTPMGLAFSHAHAHNHVQQLSLTSTEGEQLAKARRILAAATGLPGLRRGRPAWLVDEGCLELRAALDLVVPGAVAFALGHEPALHRPILVTERAVRDSRAATDDTPHLALLILHEQLHVALATGSPVVDWSPLADTVEEAVVSALDVAAEAALKEGELPASAALQMHASNSLHAELAAALLNDVDAPPAQLYPALTTLGREAVGAESEEATAQALNRFARRTRGVRGWLRALGQPLSDNE